MDATLVRFGALLRMRGIRISPPETVDAARALGHVDLARREQVKTALQATLVKDGRDVALFDELFEAFFRVAPLVDGSPTEEVITGSTGSAGADAQNAPEDAADIDASMGSSDKERTELGQFFAEDEAAGEKPAFSQGEGDMPGRGREELMIGEAQDAEGELDLVLHLDRVSDPGAPGEFNFDPGRMIEGDAAADGVHAHHLPTESLLEETDVDALREALGGGGIENLEEMLRAHLQKLKALEAPQRPALDPLVAKHAHFSEEEERRMEALLVRTSRDLHGALSHRREPSPRGRLSSARTMRVAMRTGGLPFRPITVERREDRPRLAVLVDISLSVRNTARFTLHLVAGLQAMFGKVRTFAFVADLVEVSDLLRREPLQIALAMMFGGDVLDVDANSNYGRALQTFHDEFLAAVDRRTTVVILGDGRGNGNPPQLWALEEIARRARDVVWLTPELERYWPFGSSDMRAYAELCDRVEVVRDLEGLESVAGNVLMPRRR